MRGLSATFSSWQSNLFILIVAGTASIATQQSRETPDHTPTLLPRHEKHAYRWWLSLYDYCVFDGILHIARRQNIVLKLRRYKAENIMKLFYAYCCTHFFMFQCWRKSKNNWLGLLGRTQSLSHANFSLSNDNSIDQVGRNVVVLTIPVIGWILKLTFDCLMYRQI